jgi:hypothetical protein
MQFREEEDNALVVSQKISGAILARKLLSTFSVWLWLFLTSASNENYIIHSNDAMQVCSTLV